MCDTELGGIKMKISNSKLYKLMEFDNDLNDLYKKVEMDEIKLQYLQESFKNLGTDKKKSL